MRHAGVKLHQFPLLFLRFPSTPQVEVVCIQMHSKTYPYHTNSRRYTGFGLDKRPQKGTFK
jgi:hypothetical protein